MSLYSLATKIKKYIILKDLCAAAAAKSLQSCPTLYNPIDGSLPGSPVPEILQNFNTFVCMCI